MWSLDKSNRHLRDETLDKFEQAVEITINKIPAK